MSIAELSSGQHPTRDPAAGRSDGRVNVVDFSPDGTRIAAGDIDGRLTHRRRLRAAARRAGANAHRCRPGCAMAGRRHGRDHGQRRAGRAVRRPARARAWPTDSLHPRRGEDGGYLVTASHDELVVAGARPPDAASPCRCRAGWRTPAGSPAETSPPPMGVLRPVSAVPPDLRLAVLNRPATPVKVRRVSRAAGLGRGRAAG